MSTNQPLKRRSNPARHNPASRSTRSLRKFSSSQRRLACFETFFGASPKSHSSKNHEAEPEYEFTVVEYGPTKERQFSTLITSGLSDYRLPEPDVDQLEVPSSWSCRIEMILYVQTVEPRFISFAAVSRSVDSSSAPMDRLRDCGGQRIATGAHFPAQPFIEFCFSHSVATRRFLYQRRTSDRGRTRLSFVGSSRFSAAERQLIERHGVSEFCRLCDERCDPLVLTPDRPCYLTDFGRTVRSPSFSINPR